MVLGVLAATALSRYLSLRQPLVEVHPFRQTQTAYPAVLFSEQGIDLLHPTLPVLGRPFEVPFEFPLFQAFASLVMDAGIRPDPALRITGLAFFLATAALIYLIVRRLAGIPGAVAATLVFVASPFGLVWSRTSMIEYLATAAVLAWVLCWLIWVDRRRWGWLVGAVAAGVVAAMVKITTAAFWGLPIVALFFAVRPVRGRASLQLAVAIAIPALAGLAWTGYADGIKSGNPFAAQLTSGALGAWNFGSIPQRLAPAEQDLLIQRAILGLGGWWPAATAIVAAAAAVVALQRRAFWIALVGVVILPPLVLFNLYAIHDYYWIAVTPAAAMLAGAGVAAGWSHLPRLALRALLSVGLVAILVVGLADGSGYWRPIYGAPADPAGVLPAAAALEGASEPDDLVLVIGADWSPAILYYARRQGLAMPDWAIDSPAARDLAGSGYRVAEYLDPATGPLALLRQWPWVGVTGGLTYAMGSTSADLRGAPLVSYLGDAPMEAPPVALRLLPGPMRIPCEAGLIQLPMGAKGTWIEFSPAPPGARLWIVNAFAPVPVGRWVFVSAAVRGISGFVTCNGAGSLVARQVLDAAVP
jgi:4-amino-4-deoxy-L-arabinose transferase-like glycosyltransferase